MVTHTERHPPQVAMQKNEDASKTLEINKSFSKLDMDKINSTLRLKIGNATSTEKPKNRNTDGAIWRTISKLKILV